MENCRVEWRVITEHPNYEVSKFGDVRRVRDGLPLYPSSDANRVTVAVRAQNKTKQLGIARLVYAAFCGAIPDGYHVFHRDGDYTNNTPQNLFLEKRGYK